MPPISITGIAANDAAEGETCGAATDGLRVAAGDDPGAIAAGAHAAISITGASWRSLCEPLRVVIEGKLHQTDTADTRIHGTTREQVRKLFEQVEKPALRSLPFERFPLFHEARRMVNRDGHVEVDKSYYSVPAEFLGRTGWVRWDSRVVRVFDPNLRQIAVQAAQLSREVRQRVGEHMRSNLLLAELEDDLAESEAGSLSGVECMWVRTESWFVA